MVSLHTPLFWNARSSSAPAFLLTPVSWMYRGGAALRRAVSIPRRFEKPVICVGNISVGGTGKTPVVDAILDLARQKGIRAAAASRGYGGVETGPTKVDSARHLYSDVGDEPLLLAQKGAEVWVAKSRVRGVEAAIRDGADLVVMDDGFQNPTIEASASLLVFDGAVGVGNGRVLPAGPLRETLKAAVKRTDAILILGEDQCNLTNVIASLSKDSVPIYSGAVRSALPLHFDPSRSVFAFCGVGRPEKVFKSFAKAGLNLVGETPFQDHHPYSENDLALLCQKAEEADARLITTEKDLTRVPDQFRNKVTAIPAKLSVAGGVEPLFAKLIET